IARFTRRSSDRRRFSPAFAHGTVDGRTVHQRIGSAPTLGPSPAHPWWPQRRADGATSWQERRGGSHMTPYHRSVVARQPRRLLTLLLRALAANAVLLPRSGARVVNAYSIYRLGAPDFTAARATASGRRLNLHLLRQPVTAPAAAGNPLL